MTKGVLERFFLINIQQLRQKELYKRINFSECLAMTLRTVHNGVILGILMCLLDRK